MVQELAGVGFLLETNTGRACGHIRPAPQIGAVTGRAPQAKFSRVRTKDRASLVSVEQHGKLPDAVFYFGRKEWLLLVESVTNNGPVGQGSLPLDISWETEVWCADTPTHLIHFNGKRFLGPYTNNK